MSASTNHRRNLAYSAFGIGIPVVATVAAAALQLAAWGSLHDRIVTHWNASGDADRWASPAAILAVTVIVGAVLPLAMTIPNLRPLHDGSRGPAFRLIAAISAATSVGVAALLTASVVGQTDDRTPQIGTVLGIGLVAAVIVGVAAWALIPRDEPREPGQVEPLTTVRGQRLIWISTETAGKMSVIAVVCGLVITLSCAVAAASSIDSTGATIAACVLVVVIVLAIATVLAFHVRVDESGLHVRSIAGFPNFHVAVDDIASVNAIELRPIGDFGGYGVRFYAGATGVVLRAGHALEVTRTSGRRFVVTMRDARTAAAALAAVVEHHRSSDPAHDE